MSNAQAWKQHDAGSYDSYAALYGRYIERLAPALAERACELAGAREGQRALDVGCGTGLATRQVALRVGSSGAVVGIDLSRGMVETARGAAAPPHAGSIEFRVMDAEALDFPDAIFDVVISLCAVSHFPDIRTALSEMYRVLEPGGRLVVSSGSVRPTSVTGLVQRYVKRLIRELQRPVRPQLRGPDSLFQFVRTELPEPAEPMEPDWIHAGLVERLLQDARAAGFENLVKSSLSYDVRFDSAEEFWEAQMAIATPVRKRVEGASPDRVGALRQRYVSKAETVLRKGGELVYPYGAVFLSGNRPLAAVRLNRELPAP